MTAPVRVQKPAVLASLRPTNHAVIEASAGTGKTYALEHLVIDLILEADAELSELLVVTFTDKAARELRTRVRAAMQAILRSPGNGSSSSPGPAWTIDGDARARLERAVTSFDTAHISTIHAFCRRVLTDNAFENRRLFIESLVDGKQAFRRAFLEVLRKRFARAPDRVPYLDAWLDRSDLEDLADLLYETHQRRGLFWPEHDEAKLLGTMRALRRLELDPGTLRPQLAELNLAPSTQKAISGRTLKLRRLLADHADQPGAFLGALEAEEEQPGGFIQFVIERLAPAVKTRGTLFEYLEALKRLRADTPPLASAIAQLFVPEVREALAQSKAARGELDFDDMLDLVRDGLEGNHGDALARSLRGRFRFILIDEFQDTDPVQWRVFERAFLEGERGHRFFVIGDPKQAIYGFRGADVRTYLSARKRLLDLGGQTVHLSESYRAGPALIEAVNLVLDQKRKPPFFSGQIRYDHPVTSGRKNRGGLVVNGVPKTPVHVFRPRPSAETMSSSDRRRTLAHRIAAEIRDLLAAGVTWQKEDGAHRLGPRDFFVLTRTGREGREVANHLRQAGLPNAFYRQEGLFQTTEADDVRWLLAAIAEPRVRARRLRAFMGPFFSIPLSETPRTVDLTADHPLVRQLHDWKALAEAREYERLFFTILDDSGLVRRELFLRQSERELTNYLHIFEILEAEVAKARLPLHELVHTLSSWIERRGLPPGQDGNVERLESERDAVQIMTMHKAKGLEAPVVFLFGGFDEPETQSHVFHDAEGRRRLFLGHPLPDPVRQEQREEDERLIYVALTRAQARLYLPYLGDSVAPAETPTGSHQVLEEALNAVLSSELSAFEVEDVPEVPYRPSLYLHPEAMERLRQWNVPKSQSAPRGPAVDFDALRASRRGPPITSYSRLKSEEAPSEHRFAPVEEDEVVGEERTALERPADEARLPAGAATGRFLHEMLEVVDLDCLRTADTAEAWASRPEVQTACREGLARHNLPAPAEPDALRLVHRALTTTLDLGETSLEGGIVEAERVIRELEFLYPASNPHGDQAAFVKGFIDVVFEHEGRVFLLDWKSDALPDFATPALNDHVREHYLLQAELYTLSLVRLLTLDSEAKYEARFGGAAYVFLRALDDGTPGRGQWFWKPTFAEVQQLIARLSARFDPTPPPEAP